MKTRKLFIFGMLIASLLIFTGCEEMDTSGIFNETPSATSYDSGPVVSKIDKALAQTIRTEVTTGKVSANKKIASLEARIDAIDKKCKAMSQDEFLKLVKSSPLDLAFSVKDISSNTTVFDDTELKSVGEMIRYLYEDARKDMKGLIKGIGDSESPGDMGSVYVIVSMIEKALENGSQITDTTLAEIPDDIIYTFLEKQDGDYFRSFLNQQKLTEVSKSIPDYYNQMFGMLAMLGQMGGEKISMAINPITTTGGLNSYASWIVTDLLMNREFIRQIKLRKLPEYIKQMKEGNESNSTGFFDDINSKTDIKEDKTDNNNDGISEFKLRFRIK